MTCEEGELNTMDDDELFEHMLYHGSEMERLYSDRQEDEALKHRVRVGQINDAMTYQLPDILRDITRARYDPNLTGISWDHFPTEEKHE
ncbi:hypothetical protein A3F00_03760 [Candidatus Daviesbacteria bacterium RIFCSPHIGHO2_12_FULL_37_11]|uniref:Uncharacterized protein n=1 Tax=Candidatus Daviesbacteria bacterium RIFCSPHIGHO2_12_FULL_37_11 TaxID=1797777 RepID=A0A1F5KB86_9BACT|nr:MAG: hypothetical protein A3F00_03760 [Candidatus Daviesbacteria bacterium RIFCSPHIGHO2_12_FULL_37_11]OGE45869.1 MAG: hypothetical protein A3B39_01545 [Candidatus Daviesbacteria bacterium RIFCSPLOWO2_01_FULL_37_10]